MTLPSLRSTALGCALVAAAAFAHAATPAPAADVVNQLTAAGHAEVRDVEFEDGLWEAEVRRSDGRWGEVHVDPASGEIFDRADGRPLLDRAAIVQSLERLGYRSIDDLERDGAVWSADAEDGAGARVELRIGGHDGRVLHSEEDLD